MAKHQKHTNLIRPGFSKYGRNVWAIHGTNCSTIQELVRALLPLLAEKHKVAYVDTDHRSFKEELRGEYLEPGASFSISDKQSFQSIEQDVKDPDFSFKIMLQDADITLVNGNHHTGEKQIVFLDENKVDSLERKADRLTNIQAFIPLNSYNVVPTHIIDLNPAYSDIPFVYQEDIDTLAKLILEDMEVNKPVLKGLVLAGGKSVRMGQDKSKIEYEGKSALDRTVEMLGSFVEEVFVSGRPDQDFSGGFQFLEDRFIGLGPYGGILTAFMSDPNAAWLVVACDLPLVDQHIIEQLIAGRKTSSYATSFKSPVNEFPEPLIAIWEPKSYMRLLEFLALGYSCPRKVLINSEVALLTAADPQKLMNVNTPEDLKVAQEILMKGM